MKFIAHRGYSHRFPENSLEAFGAVINHPCNGSAVTGIELDVHLTADNSIVVMHEVEVLSVDGSMIPVAQCTFDKLQELHRRQYNETRPKVPAMSEVLSLVNHQTELCFEIKIGTYDLQLFTHLFAEELTRYNPQGDVVISSFSWDILEYVRPHLSHLDVQYGYIVKDPALLAAIPDKVRRSLDYIHPWFKLLFTNPELFSTHSKPIRCWTVNDAETVASLITLSRSLPIDAIMTDNIELAATSTGT